MRETLVSRGETLTRGTLVVRNRTATLLTVSPTTIRHSERRHRHVTITPDDHLGDPESSTPEIGD